MLVVMVVFLIVTMIVVVINVRVVNFLKIYLLLLGEI